MTNRDQPFKYVDFLNACVAEVNDSFQNAKSVKISVEQVDDFNKTIQRVYDTREGFVVAANRYFSRCLLVLAAIFAGAKFALEIEQESTRWLLLTLVGGASVGACYLAQLNKNLMSSVYFLYSSSALSATIKSLASGLGQHSWCDAMETAAKALDEKNIESQKTIWNSLSFGLFLNTAQTLPDKARANLANQ